MTATCVKCGSNRVIPRAKLYDQGEYSDGTLKAAFERNPSAWFFKGRVLSNLCAVICGDCGFTELYVQDPGALYEAFHQNDGNAQRSRDSDNERLESGTATGGTREGPDTESECLECGAVMAADQQVCPSCGWTYQGAEQE